MESATQSAFFIIVLIFSVMVHEISHGFAALFLGDKTAKYAGRLTLNPIPHIDLFGSIILPLMLFFFQSPILFGWAKPVPYNPYNLRNQKWGPALVGAAGPGSNILI
ncbi:MAG: site-2 protease family protein, partial [Candidatus Sungbacteria bacterium]|nr:site-2 protease family protein [Candidatus Sungbacteria bacterium]